MVVDLEDYFMIYPFNTEIRYLCCRKVIRDILNMRMIKFIIPVFFFHFFMICDLCAQVDTTHKNIVSISPLCLINQTISLSYTRQLNKTFDIEINPRIRIQPYKNLDNCVYANGWIVYHSNNPYWYYNKYTLRLSVLYHLKWIYIEPIYQFEYGYFKNQTIWKTHI